MLIPHNTFTPSFWIVINPKPQKHNSHPRPWGKLCLYLSIRLEVGRNFRKPVLSMDTPRGSWEDLCSWKNLTQNGLQKSPHSRPTAWGPRCQVMAGLLSTWTRPCVGRWSGNKGRPSEGKAGSCAPPSPLLVTVGPGRPGPDPTWVISAECEVRPVVGPAITPPSLVSQVLRVQGAEPHAAQHRNPLSLAPLPKGSSPTRSGLKPLGGRSC